MACLQIDKRKLELVVLLQGIADEVQAIETEIGTICGFVITNQKKPGRRQKAILDAFEQKNRHLAKESRKTIKAVDKILPVVGGLDNYLSAVGYERQVLDLLIAAQQALEPFVGIVDLGSTEGEIGEESNWVPVSKSGKKLTQVKRSPSDRRPIGSALRWEFFGEGTHEQRKTLSSTAHDLKILTKKLCHVGLRKSSLVARNDPKAPYMPAIWFENEFGIPPERLRTARRQGRITSEKISEDKKRRYLYSVPDAMTLWPEEGIALPTPNVEQPS